MMWFLSVVVVAAMGVVAVVAAGRGGSMREVHRDRPDSTVPTEGPLTAEDLRRLRLNTALRGYDVAEVDALLDRLIEQLEEGEQGRPHLRHEPPAPHEPDHPEGPPLS